MNQIIWERYYTSDGAAWLQPKDPVTGMKKGPAVRDAYDVGREQASKFKSASLIDQNDFRMRLDKQWRRQGIIEQELRAYYNTGRQPKHPFVNALQWGISQKYPQSLGWQIHQGPSISSNGFFVDIPLVAQNINTHETVLIDTHNLTRNQQFNNTYMHMMKHAYMEQYPDSHISDVVQFNAGHTYSFSQPYTFYSGQPSPAGLKAYYGIGKGFFGQKRNLDAEALANAALDSSKGFFPAGSHDTRYKKVFTVFDTETEDTYRPGAIGKPVEVNAKKFGITQDGRLELIDTFERYYQGRFGGQAEMVHGYNKKVINKLQGLTGQKLGQKWTEKEKQDFLSFVEGPILGHNIANFDFEALRLTSEEISQLKKFNGIIDTLQLARNFREQGVSNRLQDLFPEFLGQSTESFGIRAHGAGGDVTATALLVQEWMSGNTQMGKALKAALLSPMTLGLYTAPKGSSADALGQMFYDNKGNEYTAEEVIWMSGINNTPGSGFENTNIVGAMQSLEQQIKVFADTVTQSLRGLEFAKSAADSEYRNLSVTMAATHTGDIERLTNNALRNAPGDPELQDIYVTNAGFPEVIKKGALQQLQTIRKAQARQQAESFTGDDLDDLQAKWNFEETKGLVDAYSAARKNPMAYWDEDNNYQIGDRYPVVENGWVDRINKIDANREEAMNDLYQDAQVGGWTTAYIQNQVAALPKGSSDDGILGEALNESYTLRAFREYDRDWEKHLKNMKQESSLWEKIDQHSIKAAAGVAVAVTNLAMPAAQRASVAQAYGAQAQSVAHSLSWLPRIISNPINRATSAMNNYSNALAAQLQLGQEQGTAIGSAITGAGTSIGTGLMFANPIVGAAVSGVSTLTGSLISGIMGGGWQTKEQLAHVVQKGQDLSNSFNMFGSLVEMIKAPFVGLFGVLRTGIGLFNKFNKLMSVFNNLGLPYTALTGVSYGQYEQLSLLDRGLGLQAGSSNKSHNDWAAAQMGLYTMGSVDTNRLVASAMLGVFDNTYANGGDTQLQYAATVNKLVSDIETNPQTKQRTMYLAGQISPTMQSELSMLLALRSNPQYAGMTYEKMKEGSTWGITTTAAKDKDKYQARFYAARFGISAASQELLFQGQRVGVSAWEQLGRPITDGLIKTLSTVVSFIERGDWKGAMDTIKTQVKEWWKAILDHTGIDGTNLDSLWDSIALKLQMGWNKIAPKLEPMFQAVLDIWQWLVQKMVKILVDVLVDVLGEIANYKIDYKALLGQTGLVPSLAEYGRNNPVISYYGAYQTGAWDRVKTVYGWENDIGAQASYKTSVDNALRKHGIDMKAQVEWTAQDRSDYEKLLDIVSTFGGPDEAFKKVRFWEALAVNLPKTTMWTETKESDLPQYKIEAQQHAEQVAQNKLSTEQALKGLVENVFNTYGKVFDGTLHIDIDTTNSDGSHSSSSQDLGSSDGQINTGSENVKMYFYNGAKKEFQRYSNGQGRTD